MNRVIHSMRIRSIADEKPVLELCNKHGTNICEVPCDKAIKLITNILAFIMKTAEENKWLIEGVTDDATSNDT